MSNKQKIIDLQVDPPSEFSTPEEEAKYNEEQKERIEEISKLEKQIEDQKAYIEEMIEGDENASSTLNLILKGQDYGTVETLEMLIKRIISEFDD